MSASARPQVSAADKAAFVEHLRRDVGLDDNDIKTVTLKGGVLDTRRLDDYVAMGWPARELSPAGADRLYRYHDGSSRGSAPRHERHHRPSGGNKHVSIETLPHSPSTSSYDTPDKHQSSSYSAHDPPVYHDTALHASHGSDPREDPVYSRGASAAPSSLAPSAYHNTPASPGLPGAVQPPHMRLSGGSSVTGGSSPSFGAVVPRGARPDSPRGDGAAIPVAGASSRPRKVGKKCLQHGARQQSPPPASQHGSAQRGSPRGATDTFFARGSNDSGPYPEKERRRIGVRASHVLPGDYPEHSYMTSADSIGAGVCRKEDIVDHEPNHDTRLAQHEKDGTDGTRAGWRPPGGWMRDCTADGYRGVLPPDSNLFFDGRSGGGFKNASITGATGSTSAGRLMLRPYGTDSDGISPHIRMSPDYGEAADRNTRPRHRLPSDIPKRPPGGGCGAPSPANHLWRMPEEVGVTAVVDKTRPQMLPRTARPATSPPKQRAAAYTIFAKDPFNPTGYQGGRDAQDAWLPPSGSTARSGGERSPRALDI